MVIVMVVVVVVVVVMAMVMAMTIVMVSVLVIVVVAMVNLRGYFPITNEPQRVEDRVASAGHAHDAVGQLGG